jgi:hypothetical protein
MSCISQAVVLKEQQNRRHAVESKPKGLAEPRVFNAAHLMADPSN